MARGATVRRIELDELARKMPELERELGRGHTVRLVRDHRVLGEVSPCDYPEPDEDGMIPSTLPVEGPARRADGTPLPDFLDACAPCMAIACFRRGR